MAQQCSGAPGAIALSQHNLLILPPYRIGRRGPRGPDDGHGALMPVWQPPNTSPDGSASAVTPGAPLRRIGIDDGPLLSNYVKSMRARQGEYVGEKITHWSGQKKNPKRCIRDLVGEMSSEAREAGGWRSGARDTLHISGMRISTLASPLSLGGGTTGRGSAMGYRAGRRARATLPDQ